MKSFNKYDLFAENSRFYLLWADMGFLRGSERAGQSNKFGGLCDEESG